MHSPVKTDVLEWMGLVDDILTRRTSVVLLQVLNQTALADCGAGRKGPLTSTTTKTIHTLTRMKAFCDCGGVYKVALADLACDVAVDAP